MTKHVPFAPPRHPQDQVINRISDAVADALRRVPIDRDQAIDLSVTAFSASVGAAITQLYQDVSQLSGGLASRGWPDVLANDKSSGLFNPHIEGTQYVSFGSSGSLPPSGQLRSSTGWGVNVLGSLELSSSAAVNVNAIDLVVDALTEFEQPIARTGVQTDSRTGNLGTIVLSGSTNVFRWTAVTAPAQIAGFTGGYEGRELWVANANSDPDAVLELLPESATVAADRMTLAGRGSVSVEERKKLVYSRGLTLLRYDATSDRWYAAVPAPASSVQLTTTGGVINNFALDEATTVLVIDTGNTDFAFSGFAGGWDGRQLDVICASNSGAEGRFLHNSSDSSVGNQMLMPESVDFGFARRCGIRLVYDGRDGFWRTTNSERGLSRSSVTANATTTGNAFQTIATVTIPSGSAYAGMSYRFNGSAQDLRIGVTVHNLELEFRVAGVRRFVVDKAVGAANATYRAQVDGTFTFVAAASAATQYLLHASSFDDLTTAGTVVSALSGSILTVDNTADVTLDVRVRKSVSNVSASLTPMGGSIIKVQ